MKELSIEEKARRYDEAIERAKKLYEQGTITESLSYVFPELTESEDERIRKWLICTLKSLNNSPVQIDGAYEMMLPAIAWLEKQGNQSPVDVRTTGYWHVEDVEKNPTWSKEDESIALGIEQLCNCASLLNIAPDKIDKIKTWLRNLKDRVQPQNTWKPNEQEILLLERVISGKLNPKDFQASLQAILEELKKL